MMAEKKVSFGFETINESEKAARVSSLFSNVAHNYDLMNDLMSLGTHRLWKDQFIRALTPHPKRYLLDVAGGTGDIARGFLNQGGGRATILDLNFDMMKAGIGKAIDKAVFFDDRLNYLNGNAEMLPLIDNSVDLYSIAFGLRNVTDIDKALREAKRVLKPGGQFFCLEFSKVVLPLFDKAYDQYSFIMVPKIGKIVANDEKAYRYLVESIRRFPDQQNLQKRMMDAGFKHVNYRNLSAGIVAIHHGWKL